jgi:hypothetical protein
VRREITQGHRGGKRGADHEHGAEPLEHVAGMARQRCGEQVHGGASAEREPELLRRQLARAAKGREKE